MLRVQSQVTPMEWIIIFLLLEGLAFNLQDIQHLWSIVIWSAIKRGVPVFARTHATVFSGWYWSINSISTSCRCLCLCSPAGDYGLLGAGNCQQVCLLENHINLFKMPTLGQWLAGYWWGGFCGHSQAHWARMPWAHPADELTMRLLPPWGLPRTKIEWKTARPQGLWLPGGPVGAQTAGPGHAQRAHGRPCSVTGSILRPSGWTQHLGDGTWTCT